MSLFEQFEDEKMDKNKVELNDREEDFNLEEDSKTIKELSIQLTAINNVLQKNKDKLELFLKLKDLDIQNMKDAVKIYENGTSLYVEIHNILKSDLEVIQKNIIDHKEFTEHKLKRMIQVDNSISKRKIAEFNDVDKSLEEIRKIKRDIYMAVVVGSIFILVGLYIYSYLV